jgi:lipopolysaccharide transport system ATP-binding protein
MYVRLAFAVAAHLEPEVLIVDEVLAVGDVAFQKKCLGKIGDAAKEGLAVLFISHNMAAVSHLCNRVMLLESGQLIENGPADAVISQYLSLGQDKAGVSLRERTDRIGNGELRFLDFSILNGDGMAVDFVVSGKEVIFSLRYAARENTPLRHVDLSIRVSDMHDYYLFTVSTHLSANDLDPLPPQGIIHCQIPAMPLIAGDYSIYLWSSVSGETADAITHAADFTVVNSDVYKSGKNLVKTKHGPFFVPHSWRLQPR